MNSQKNFRSLDLIFSILCILFFLGTIFVFHPCEAKDDGTWMTCHYAGNLISLNSAICAILAIINIFVKSETKLGLYIANFVISIGTIFIPGTLVKLCMMNDMRCNSITKPCVIIFSIIIALLAFINLIVILLNQKKSGNKWNS